MSQPSPGNCCVAQLQILDLGQDGEVFKVCVDHLAPVEIDASFWVTWSKPRGTTFDKVDRFSPTFLGGSFAKSPRALLLPALHAFLGDGFPKLAVDVNEARGVVEMPQSGVGDCCLVQAQPKQALELGDDAHALVRN